MDESTERQIIGDCLAKKGGPLSGYVASIARFGDIVESGHNSFSGLVWDGELENPVVVTLTVTPPASAATELLVSVRAAAVEGLIKQRSAAVLLPRVVAALNISPPSGRPL